MVILAPIPLRPRLPSAASLDILRPRANSPECVWPASTFYNERLRTVDIEDPFKTIDSLPPEGLAQSSNSPLPASHSGRGKNLSGPSSPVNLDATAVIESASHSGRSGKEPGHVGRADVRNSRYNRISELGRGGWGVVDRVVDKQLEREVAVKRIGGDGKLGSSRLHAEVRQRFLHEAKVTSQLQHPGVVPVHEFGTADNGESYYVMKLLEGDTLRKLIHTQHAPARSNDHRWTSHSLVTAIAPLLDRFIHVCNAVAYAHEKGVIHRDLKPANVMAGAFGETIVVDWGLAKRFVASPSEPLPGDELDCVGSTEAMEPIADSAMRELDFFQGSKHHDSESAQHTTQGSIVGTPAYMSPEQASGLVDQLRPASDIYSLGMILYEIVAGRHPYHDLDIAKILGNIKTGKCPFLTTTQPVASKSLAAICHAAMSFEPGDRYSSATALADDVRRCIAGDAVSVYDEPILVRIARLCRRHQSSCIAAALSALVLLIASIIFGAVIHRAHQSEKSARKTAQLAHREAVVSLSDARDAADEWLVELGGSLEFYPGTNSLRGKLIANAIVQYENILSDLDADIEQWSGQGYAGSNDLNNVEMAKLEQAKCHIRLGDISRIASQMKAGLGAFNGQENDLTASQAEDADLHYTSAGKIVRDLLITLMPKSDVEDLQNACRLQQMNVFIGQQFMVLAKLSTNKDSQSQGMETFKSNREWLLSQLALDSVEPKEKKSYASTLVRYEIVIYRSYQLQLPSEDALDYLKQAVHWSKWLTKRNGQSMDQALSEAAQRELATKLESDALIEQAAEVWSGLASDLELWTAGDQPRPDRLQSLAYARMRYAHLSATLLQNDVAIESYRRAIDDLSYAWNLVDSDSFYRTNLATAQHNLGKLIASSSPEFDEAEQWLSRSISNYRELLKNEATPYTIRRLCEANGSLAELFRRDRMGDAMKHYNDAALGYQMLSDHQWIRDEDRVDWSEILIARANGHHSMQNSELAKQDLAAAAKQIEQPNPDDLSDAYLTRLSRAKAFLMTGSPESVDSP